MSKNVLIITGSPRKDGNSDLLATSFAKGAESKGHTVTIFEAGRKKIAGCINCDKCWSKEGQACVITDDFTILEPLLEKADSIVFATPLYWYTFSSQVKAVLDRTYSYNTEKVLRRLPVKEMALLATAADEAIESFNGLVASFESILAFSKLGNAGILTVPGVWKKGDINNTDGLSRAEILGASI